MEDIDPLVCQAVGDLRDIFPAYLHEQRIRLHHVDLLDIVILDQLPDDASVAPAHDKHFLYIRVHCHRHVGDHLVVDELIPLCQHQIPVHHKDLPEIFRLQHINPLHLALGAEKLLFDAYGQLHPVRMYV